jgi:hypothetical protein
VGPARIHSFEFLVDGVAVPSGYLLRNIAEACCEKVRRAVRAGAGEDQIALGDSMNGSSKWQVGASGKRTSGRRCSAFS